ncbi:hypothetical protein LCH21_02040 [Patescibacteria group bacterium]|nr:hypothetical protein [Patescibacteria group bacterium]
MAAPQPGMKKRQIIANSNRTMFFWVAGMSAIVGVCAVASIFLVQQLAFKTKVTVELNKTLSVVTKNNKVANQLIENVRLRGTDASLSSIKAQPDDQALQVVLDAMPADENTLALGSSLQQKLIGTVDGVTIESLAVDPPVSADYTVVNSSVSASDGPQKMTFTTTVSATDPNLLKELLVKLERSIRVIDVDDLMLEKGATKYTMTLKAHAYYMPATSVELTDKVVKPNEKK